MKKVYMDETYHNDLHEYLKDDRNDLREYLKDEYFKDNLESTYSMDNLSV